MISLSEIKIDIEKQIEKFGEYTAYKFSFYRKDGDERIRTIVEYRDLSVEEQVGTILQEGEQK